MYRAALFVDGDLSATLQAQLERAGRAVDEIPEARFTATEPSIVATDVYTQFRVEPLELTEGAISVEAEDADIDRRMFRDMDQRIPGAPSTIRGTRVIYNVPYVGDPTLFRLTPSTRTSVVPHAVCTQSELRFVYEVRSSDVAGTKNSFEKDLSLTKRYIRWSHDEVSRFDEELRQTVEAAVNSRSSRLAQAAEGLAELGIPVRRAEPARVRVDVVDSSDPTPTGNTEEGRSYDVALSFAGEDRGYVEAVAEFLRDRGVHVFYDGFEKASLWGKDLVEHLQDIYQNRSTYCVIFVSESYVNKPWPKHERRSAQARALVANEEYLLPARFDDTELPGLPPTIGFVDLRGMDPPEFGRLVLDKLGWAGENN